MKSDSGVTRERLRRSEGEGDLDAFPLRVNEIHALRESASVSGEEIGPVFTAPTLDADHAESLCRRETDAQRFEQLVARALTLRERLGGATTPLHGDTSIAAERLTRWRTTLEFGGVAEAFERRLALDNLSEAACLNALGEVSLAPSFPLPPWASTLEEILREVAERERASCSADPSLAATPPDLAEILVPIVVVARRRLRAAGTVEQLGAGLQDLERSLLLRLHQISAAALNEQFHLFVTLRDPLRAGTDQSGAHRNAFCEAMHDGDFRELLDELPVLSRLLAVTVDNWVGATIEFADRLRSDAPDIRQSFPGLERSEVVAVRSGLSDPHDGGRSVLRVTFACGLVLAYKPRPLSAELRFGQLLRWLRERGCDVDLLVPTVIDRGTHGWMEWLHARQCDEPDGIPRFYERAGVLLALLYMLDGTDIHAENLIAAGEQPVLVDLETLLRPVLARASELAGVLESTVDDSVLKTEMLPHHVLTRGITYDNSALGGRPSEMIGSAHLPAVDGRVAQAADYVDEVVRGFEKGYRVVLDARDELLSAGGPIEAFGVLRPRLVLRPTAIYGFVLQRTVQVSALRDGADWSMVMESLARFYVPSDDGCAHPWRFYHYELLALENVDVPRFHAEASALTVKSGERGVGELLEERPVARLRHLISSLSERDLQLQVMIIDESLARHP